MFRVKLVSQNSAHSVNKGSAIKSMNPVRALEGTQDSLRWQGLVQANIYLLSKSITLLIKLSKSF